MIYDGTIRTEITLGTGPIRQSRPVHAHKLRFVGVATQGKGGCCIVECLEARPQILAIWKETKR